jgi:transcriptional regulator with XRE-family HTH domain
VEINPARRAGGILKLMREDAGLSQDKLGKDACISGSLLSYIESGSKPAFRDNLERLGRALNGKVTNMEAVLLAVWGFVGNDGYSGTADMLASYESEATRIDVFENRVVPGLLQTPEYARAVIRAARTRDTWDAIENDVNERIARQSILAQPDLISFFILDESVLLRPFGGRDVMRDQLRKLEAAAEEPNICVQVLPFSAVRHPGLEGPLRLMEFRDNPPVWYTEGYSAGRMADDKDEVAERRSNLDIIRASALSPEQSAEFIASARERYE